MKALLWIITALCLLVWIAGLFGAGPMLAEAQHGLLLFPLFTIFVHVVSELLKKENTSET